MYKLSQNSINKLDKIHPKLVLAIQKSITNSPFDFIIVQGFRTAEYQKVVRHIELVAREFGIKVEWDGDWKSLKDNPYIELKKIVE